MKKTLYIFSLLFFTTVQNNELFKEYSEAISNAKEQINLKKIEYTITLKNLTHELKKYEFLALQLLLNNKMQSFMQKQFQTVEPANKRCKSSCS